MKIEQLSIGQPKKITDAKGTWYSGIFREAVATPVELTQQGHTGDAVADTKNHGSPDQAVCCHPLTHYDAWNREFGLSDAAMLGAGAVGENWTLTNVTEQNVCIGDIYRVGTARVQVSAPRYPCMKQERKVGVKGFLKRTGETLRTGWYLRVLTPGTVQAGDELTLEARPQSDWTVQRVNAHMHHQADAHTTHELLALPELAEGWKGMIRLVQSRKSR